MDEKCRLCLARLENQRSNATIEEEGFREKLKTLFSFPITSIEAFPSTVCVQCEARVSDFHTYHEQVKSNQDQLWSTQHQKYFEEVKVEPAPDADYDVFELPFEEAEPVEGAPKESCKNEPDSKCQQQQLQQLDEQTIDSDLDDGMKLEDEYNPPSSSAASNNNSDDSEYEVKPRRSKRVTDTADRTRTTRRGRPPKSEAGTRSPGEQKKKSPIVVRRCQATNETNQKLREFYDMKCEMCEEQLESFTALKNHYYRTHRTPGYIKCCGRTFHSRYRLLEHLSYHVGSSMVRCEECNKTFSSRSYLLVHRSRVHGQAEDRPYKCTQCHQSYAMECHLKAHIVSHVRVNCTICGKELASALSLRTHMINMHGNRENHICDSCGREFRSRQAFERHVKLHLGLEVAEQVQCEVCHKWLNSKRALKMHVKLVHMEAGQTFQCDICSQQCPNSRALANHKQRVHVEERFKCEECGKLFKRQLYLKEHVAALHTRKPLYSCEVCGATFNSNANKYSHRKNKHPVEWEERRKQQLQQQQEQQQHHQQQQQEQAVSL
ncbi:transcription factor grauzone [Anopheles gambiae]|uniref:transcription factor grauzone n=1 Tax=Anopheles gambiae TaxID=7165 RepID=UPI002AC9B61F|nr:transcription factor grauzone [Anopheles gambiae]